MKRRLVGLLLIAVVGWGTRLQKLEVEVEPNEQGIQSSPSTAPEAESNTFTGKVLAVKVDDSIVILRDTGQIDIRLRDADCPELAQPFDRQAKKQTSDLCFGETVTVEAIGKDSSGRALAYINLSDGNEVGRGVVAAFGRSSRLRPEALPSS